MADIAASDVSYTINLDESAHLGRQGRKHYVTIAFGDGALTVPAGGIPLTKASMGCPTKVYGLNIIESAGGGYKFEYDVSAEKLLIMYYDYDGAADGEAITAATVAIAAQSLVCEVIGY